MPTITIAQTKFDLPLLQPPYFDHHTATLTTILRPSYHCSDNRITTSTIVPQFQSCSKIPSQLRTLQEAKKCDHRTSISKLLQLQLLHYSDNHFNFTSILRKFGLLFFNWGILRHFHKLLGRLNVDNLNVDARLFIIGFMGGTVTQVNLECLPRLLTVQVNLCDQILKQECC
ncbi:hypothetical protein P3S68_003919 [Capsicum galapagoense]